MIDIDNYPYDPLKMPPPYWEDSDPLDQLIRSLEMVNYFFPNLPKKVTVLVQLLMNIMIEKKKLDQNTIQNSLSLEKYLMIL